MALSQLRIGQRLALVFTLVITVLQVMAAAVGTRYPNNVLANKIKCEVGEVGEVGEVSRSMMSVQIMNRDDQVKQELCAKRLAALRERGRPEEG